MSLWVSGTRTQLVDLPDAVVQATPVYRALAAALEQARRDAVEARTADADSRGRLDSYLSQRHAFVEEMEARWAHGAPEEALSHLILTHAYCWG